MTAPNIASGQPTTTSVSGWVDTLRTQVRDLGDWPGHIPEDTLEAAESHAKAAAALGHMICGTCNTVECMGCKY